MNHYALICDDNYALPTAVTVKSIVDNCCGSKNCIHICCAELNGSNETMIQSLENSNNRIEINRIDGDFLSKLRTRISPKTHVSISALIKFELPNIFQEIDRLLYLDSDIIVFSDLSDLFDTNLDSYYLSASFELWKLINSYLYCFGKTDNLEFYFNSGVMLMNLKAMRDNDISNKLWEHKLHDHKSYRMDQDSLNAICKGKVLPLSIEYNFNPAFLNEKYISDINKVYGKCFGSISSMQESVKIIHYVGKQDKPWLYEGGKMQDVWLSYYYKINRIGAINLKKYIQTKQTFKERLKDHLHVNGFKGLISYLLYRRKRY